MIVYQYTNILPMQNNGVDEVIVKKYMIKYKLLDHETHIVISV